MLQVGYQIRRNFYGVLLQVFDIVLYEFKIALIEFTTIKLTDPAVVCVQFGDMPSITSSSNRELSLRTITLSLCRLAQSEMILYFGN